jgi:hypothetical protein
VNGWSPGFRTDAFLGREDAVGGEPTPEGEEGRGVRPEGYGARDEEELESPEEEPDSVGVRAPAVTGDVGVEALGRELITFVCRRPSSKARAG